MSGVIYRSLGEIGDNLVVIDATRRLYLGLSRDRSYYHVVHPALEDMANADGAVIRRAGQLTCRCRGGLFRGTCYRTAQAEALEAGQADAPAWFGDAAPGEIVEAYGK